MKPDLHNSSVTNEASSSDSEPLRSRMIRDLELFLCRALDAVAGSRGGIAWGSTFNGGVSRIYCDGGRRNTVSLREGRPC